MTFKEEVQRDLSGVFLNLDEFAELHRVEGKEIAVVIDEDELEKLAKVGENRSHGLVEGDMLLMGREIDLPRDLDPGRSINIDGRELVVVSSSKHMGLVELVLRQNRTG